MNRCITSLLFTILAIGGSLAQTDPHWQPSHQEFESERLGGLAISDIDGDGDSDAVSTGGLGSLVLYINDGIGVFAKEEGTSENPNRQGVRSAIIAGDLDNDGDDDLIAIGPHQGFDVWLNEGSLQFSYRLVNSQFPTTHHPVLADFDADGDLDVALGHRGGFSVHPNDGAGTFGDPTQVLPSGWTNSNVIDFALAGSSLHMVLQTTGREDELYIAQNTRDNPEHPTVFAAERVFSDGTLGTNSQILSGNFIADGSTNLLRVTRSRFAGEGSVGKIGVTQAYRLPERIGSTHFDVGKGDVNGDGLDDFFVTGDGVSFYLGEAALTETSFPKYLTLAAANLIHRAALGDFNGDEKLDVFALEGSRNAERPFIWLSHSEAEPTLWEPHELPATPGTFTAQSIAAGDIDGDGDDDLIVPDSTNALAIWFAEGGSYRRGTFTAIREASFVQTGDLDADGDLDLLVTSGLFNFRVHWWKNEPLGGAVSFVKVEPWSASAYTEVAQPKIVDIDGNGTLDILSVEDLGGSIRINRNESINSPLEPPAPSSIPTGTAGTALSFEPADMDGDGDQDVVVTQRDEKVTVWWNEAGEFTTSTTIAPALRVYSTRPADFDNDGHIDLLVDLKQAPGMQIWWNNGFSADAPDALSRSTLDPSLSQRGSGIRRNLLTGDVNGDGRIDILAGGGGIPGGVLYLNKGNRTLQRQGTEYSVPVTALTDLDRDGSADAVFSYFTAQGHGALSLLRTGGDPVVPAMPEFHFTLMPARLSQPIDPLSAVGDIDDDGDDDVVSVVRDPLRMNQGGSTGFYLDPQGVPFQWEEIDRGLLTQPASTYLIPTQGLWSNGLDSENIGNPIRLDGNPTFLLRAVDRDGIAHETDIRLLPDSPEVIRNLYNDLVGKLGFEGETTGADGDRLRHYNWASDAANFVDVYPYLNSSYPPIQSVTQLLSYVASTDATTNETRFTSRAIDTEVHHSYRGIELADLDADGDLDLVASSSVSPGLFFYLNDGSGLFQKAVYPSELPDVSEFRSIDVRHADTDGQVDIFVLNREGEPNRVLRNASKIVPEDGSTILKFIDIELDVGTGRTAGGHYFRAADFDADGDADILKIIGSRFEFYLNRAGKQGANNFDLYDHCPGCSGSMETAILEDDLLLTDIDGDQYVDLVNRPAGHLGGQSRIALNNRQLWTEDLTQQAPFDVDSVARFTGRHSSGDLQAFEQKDLLIYRPTLPGLPVIEVWRMQPGGGYEFSEAFQGDGTPATGDFDGDGRMDVVTGQQVWMSRENGPTIKVNGLVPFPNQISRLSPNDVIRKHSSHTIEFGAGLDRQVEYENTMGSIVVGFTEKEWFSEGPIFDNVTTSSFDPRLDTAPLFSYHQQDGFANVQVFLVPIGAALLAPPSFTVDFRSQEFIGDCAQAATINIRERSGQRNARDEEEDEDDAPYFLLLLRNFRDQVLGKSPQGRYYTQLYYRFGKDAVEVLTNRPGAVVDYLDAVGTWIPAARAAVSGTADDVQITGEMVETLTAVFELLEEDGSAELAAALQNERQALDIASLEGRSFEEALERMRNRELPNDFERINIASKESARLEISREKTTPSQKYQVFESEDLRTFQPTGEPITADGGAIQWLIDKGEKLMNFFKIEPAGFDE